MYVPFIRMYFSLLSFYLIWWRDTVEQAHIQVANYFVKDYLMYASYIYFNY